MARRSFPALAIAALFALAAPAHSGPQQNAPFVLPQRATALEKQAESYVKGDGVAADRRKALVLYEQSANLGDIWSHIMAAWLHRAIDNREGLAPSRRLLQRAVSLCAHGLSDPMCSQPVLWQELSNTEAGLYQFGEALAASRHALTLAEQQTPADPVYIAQIHQDIGSHLARIGQAKEAVAELEAARSMLEAKIPATDTRLALLLSDLGIAYQHANRYADSVKVQLRAADILVHAPNPDFGMLGILHNNIGWALKDGGQFDLAYSEFQQAAKLTGQVYGNQSTEIAYPISNMGIIRERQGRHDEAIPLNMKALVIETRFHDTMLEPLRWTLQSLSHSWKAKGRIDRAILFAKLAVNAHQEIRQRSSGLDARQAAALANDWRNMYDDLASMLVSQGRLAEAQHVLDLQKNQELIDFVRGDDSAESKSADTSLLPREAQASRNIDAAMQQPMRIAAEIDALTAKQADGTLSAEETAQLAALNQQLDASYSTFVDDVDALLTKAEAESAQAQADVTSLDLKFAGDRQEMLRQFETPTVLLQAASLGASLHLFLTTKDISIHREVAISRADLAAKVMAALQAIADRDPAADTQLAGLYDLLIRPIAADLNDSGARVVMLNLGGFLRYVPFAALRSDHGYLIEDYALVLDTPAAKTRYAAVDRSSPSAAGFGVTEAKAGFPPLPGVNAELSAIFAGASGTGSLPGTPRLNAAFTADSLRSALQGRPALLHVASHFKFVPGDETKSFLLLGDGGELNLATIRKGRGFRFGGVDLLTLSACETARGVDGEGDEVESFGAIAQMNGASAVMATLWPIADAASGRLMADFYNGLVRSKLDKAEALRRAQIAMLRGVDAAQVNLAERGASGIAADAAPAVAAPVSTRHPYYWSPYILMGNWL